MSDVTVRVKSLPSEEQDVRVTDAEGLARFQLRGNSILALGLDYRERGQCTGAKLPVFAAPALPAVTPVYLDAIPPRVKGSCGSGSSDVSTTSAGAPPVAVASAGSGVTGDQEFLRFHMPWGFGSANHRQPTSLRARVRSVDQDGTVGRLQGGPHHHPAAPPDFLCARSLIPVRPKPLRVIRLESIRPRQLRSPAGRVAGR